MPVDEAVERRIRESFAAQAMMRTLGAEMAEVGEGSATIIAPVSVARSTIACGLNRVCA